MIGLLAAVVAVCLALAYAKASARADRAERRAAFTRHPAGRCITVNGGVYADLGPVRDITVAPLDGGGVRLGLIVGTGERVAVELTDALRDAVNLGHALDLLGGHR